MAMTVGQGVEEGEQEVMAAIKSTPLVDVMLVLLIIFRITIPVVIQRVPLELPKERKPPTQTKPENNGSAVDKEAASMDDSAQRAEIRLITLITNAAPRSLAG